MEFRNEKLLMLIYFELCFFKFRTIFRKY